MSDNVIESRVLMISELVEVAASGNSNAAHW